MTLVATYKNRWRTYYYYNNDKKKKKKKLTRFNNFIMLIFFFYFYLNYDPNRGLYSQPTTMSSFPRIRDYLTILAIVTAELPHVSHNNITPVQ